MEPIKKETSISDIDSELSHLLDEISFSYMMVYSSQQSLEDLDRSIKELGDLVEGLKDRVE